MREKETVSREEAAFEELMLSLRTDLGVKFEKLPSSFLEQNSNLIEQYEKNGYLVTTKDGFSLTEEGFFVSNAIISSFRMD